VVISASLDLYVRPWAIAVGFDDVIATHLQTLDAGLVTGKLSGANCFGIEKVRRLQACWATLTATLCMPTATAVETGNCCHPLITLTIGKSPTSEMKNCSIYCA